VTLKDTEELMRRILAETAPVLRVIPKARIQLVKYEKKRNGYKAPITSWNADDFDIWLMHGRTLDVLAVITSTEEWELVAPLFGPGDEWNEGSLQESRQDAADSGVSDSWLDSL
jgi:hypothetical protein